MLVFDIVAVPCLIIIPLVLAYFINMQPPGYKIFRALIYLPSVISVSIMGIIFGNMFAGDSSGLINAWLNTEIHWLSGTPWHGDTLRWLVMLIASIWWGTGTNFVIFSGALKNIPKSLYEACEMDGGSKWKRICTLRCQILKYSIRICLFNTLLRIWHVRSGCNIKRSDEREYSCFSYDVYTELLIRWRYLCKADRVYLCKCDNIRIDNYDIRTNPKKLYGRQKA